MLWEMAVVSCVVEIVDRDAQALSDFRVRLVALTLKFMDDMKIGSAKFFGTHRDPLTLGFVGPGPGSRILRDTTSPEIF